MDDDRIKTTLELGSLSYAAFNINIALEAGHVDIISFDEFYAGLHDGTILKTLEAKLGDVIDLSLLTNEKCKEQHDAFIEVMRYVEPALEGRESRKAGIKKSGLCLLMAYVIEAMQQGYWDLKNET